MKIIKKEIVVIVDAYSTGKNLGNIFSGNGYDCIHIIPSGCLSPIYMQRYQGMNEHFKETIIHNGNINQLIKRLKLYSVKCIIPGSEAGVTLADQLIDRLELNTGNCPKLSSSRRDKFIMQATLDKHNINAIEQIRTNRLPEAIDFFRRLSAPIVIKPLSSSDAEGVNFCYHEQDIPHAFADVYGKNNQYGEKNTHVLVQRLLTGKEFIVNSVSKHGKHFITDVWNNIKTKSGGDSLYDYQKLILESNPLYKALTDYAIKILKALKINNGAAHCELIQCSNGEIYLIEVGARLSGGFMPGFTMEALGHSQVSCLVDSHLRPDVFDNLLTVKKKIRKHALIVSLISSSEGEIKHEIDLNSIKKIPGFYCIQHDLQPSSLLEKTINLRTSPGNIYFLSNSPYEIHHAYLKVRQLEKDLYIKLTK